MTLTLGRQQEHRTCKNYTAAIGKGFHGDLWGFRHNNLNLKQKSEGCRGCRVCMYYMNGLFLTRLS